MRYARIIALTLAAAFLAVPVCYSSAYSHFLSTGNQLKVVVSAGTVTYDDGGGGLMAEPAFVLIGDVFTAEAGSHTLTTGTPYLTYVSGNTGTKEITYEMHVQILPSSANTGCSVTAGVNGGTYEVPLTYGLGYLGGLGPMALDQNKHADIPLTLTLNYAEEVSSAVQPTLSLMLRVYDGEHVTEFIYGPQAV